MSPVVAPEKKVDGEGSAVVGSTDTTRPPDAVVADAAVVPPAPASSSNDAEATGWQPRRGLALALQVAIVLTPGVVSLLMSVVLGHLLPRPTTTALAAARLFTILAVSAATMVGARIIVRRLAPLPFLLRLSLAFPNETPKRLRTALRAPSARDLEHRLSDIDERGVATEPKDVATEIVSMVAAISAHHRLTRGHSERVRAYAELIGAEIGLDAQELQKLRWAALLHDLGKITVPPEILDMKHRPDPEEWAILAGHPAASARLAASLKDWLGPWWYGIGQHHERWDGTGYPERLRGEQIALAGRIVALADSYETMTAIRSYKRPMSLPAAQAEVVASAGTHFDPDVVRAFLNIGLRSLRRAAGFTAWIPLQFGGVLRHLTNLVTPLVQSPAALALATTVAANTFVPTLHATAVLAPRANRAVVVVDDDRRNGSAGGTVTSTGSRTGPDTAVEAATDAGVASVTLPVLVVAPSTRTTTAGSTAPSTGTSRPPVSPGPDGASPATERPAVPSPSGPPAPATAPADEPGPSPAGTTDLPPAPAPTAPAPTVPAPTTPAPTTAETTSAPPVTTTMPSTTTPVTTTSPLAPRFKAATKVKVGGDGRTLEVKPDIDDHGLSATCTFSILTTGLTTTAGCSSKPLFDAPLWNTTYTVRVIATSSAGSNQADVTVTTDPKTLTIDASSHWPCPGFFCGSAASGFALPSLFSSFTPHAQGTAVQLVCWTVGGTVDTRTPNSSGNEVTNIWVKSDEATHPYYSVLSFPTTGATARDGLPSC